VRIIGASSVCTESVELSVALGCCSWTCCRHLCLRQWEQSTREDEYCEEPSLSHEDTPNACRWVAEYDQVNTAKCRGRREPDHSVAANGWKEQQPGEPILRLLGSGCQDESRANEKLCSIAEMHVPERGAKERRVRSDNRWDEKAGLRRDAGALPSYRRALRHKR